MARILDLEVDDFLYRATAINPEAIQDDFIRLPSDLAYQGELLSVAIKDHLKAKLAKDQLYARLRLAYRESAAQEGKKLTESDVESLVELNTDYSRARLREIEMEAQRHSMKFRYDAIASKKEMAISLGAQIRAEMAADPSIRMTARKVPEVQLGPTDADGFPLGG